MSKANIAEAGVSMTSVMSRRDVLRAGLVGVAAVAGLRQLEVVAAEPLVTPVPVPESHAHGDQGPIQFYELNADAPMNEWFQPIYNVLTANEENDWRGIGSHGIAVAYETEGAHLKTRGNVGEFVVRMDDDADEATITVHAMTWGQNIDQMKVGTESGSPEQNSEWNMAMYVQSDGVTATAVNPDTGEAYLDEDGDPMTIKASRDGDFGIILPSQKDAEGRAGLTFKVKRDAKDGTHRPEFEFRFGPNDRTDQEGNLLDLTEIAKSEPIPAE